MEKPWQGKDWADAAEEANQGRAGQGYIVHVMMQASRIGTRLNRWVIWLMGAQIAIAVLQTWLVFARMSSN